MKLILYLLVSSLLIVSVYGHSHLVSPLAFNPSPSKASPCGGTNTFSAPVANWPPGTTQTLGWTVVAGDGTGPIRAFVDPKGMTSNFPTSVPAASSAAPTGLTELILSGTTPTTEIAYTFTFTVPNIVCDGPSGFCTVVVFASSSWWSCTAVNISSAIRITNTTSGPPPPTCQNATSVFFCSMINGKQVSIPFGQTITDLDVAAQTAYNFNLHNSKVFTTPANAGCASAYHFLICATIFRRCGTTGAIADCDYYTGRYPSGCFCSNTCYKASNLCGLNSTHTALLNCDISHIADYDITTSSCSSLVFDATTDATTPDDGLSSGGAATLVIAMSSLLVTVIFAAF